MRHHVETNEMNSELGKTGNYKIEELKSPAYNTPETNEASVLQTYKPLIIVFLYIILGMIILQLSYGRSDWMHAMNNFMGGFFLTFSFFKMLDLKNFAFSYSSYDIVAKNWFAYGYVYPFIELSLGILYLSNQLPVFTNLATVMVMGISSIGVIQSIIKKRKIQCACLGTVFNLPMSTITLVEDLLMVVMAAAMLIYVGI